MTPSFDARLFRDVMGHFATGVTVVGYFVDGKAHGMTANAFMSVSLAPPLALISVRRASRFTSSVGKGDSFGVSFLLESQEAISGHFGGRPVESLDTSFEQKLGVPLVRGSLAQLVLRTVDIHEAGDHLLYVGQLDHMELGQERRPLVFYSGAYKQVNVHTAPEIFWSGAEGW